MVQGKQNKILKMVIFKIEQVGEVLLRIYDSEINIELSSFWDGGYQWLLGDKANGYPEIEYVPPHPEINSVVDAITGLAFAAAREYPDSDFAEWYSQIAKNT